MPPLTPRQFSGIFINYRRDDSAGHAGRLFDGLNDHFDEDQIFMDVDHIEPGQDFVEVLEKAVDSCDILLTVIGRHWLVGAGRTTRRLDNPQDFVRLEVAAALQRDIRVIPVLVQGAVMPRPDELPKDLAPLSRRQAIEMRDQHWKTDLTRLVNFLEKVLAERKAEREAEQLRLEAERLRLEAEARESAEAEARRKDQEAEQERQRQAEEERKAEAQRQAEQLAREQREAEEAKRQEREAEEERLKREAAAAEEERRKLEKEEAWKREEAAARAADEQKEREAEEARQREAEAERERVAEARRQEELARERRQAEEAEHQRLKAVEAQRLMREEAAAAAERRKVEEEKRQREEADARAAAAAEEQKRREDEERQQLEAAGAAQRLEAEKRREEEARQEKERQEEERRASEARFRELNQAAKQERSDESAVGIMAGAGSAPARRGKPVVWIALGALAVVGIVVAVVLSSGGGGRPEQSSHGQYATQTSTPWPENKNAVAANTNTYAVAANTNASSNMNANMNAPVMAATPDKATFEKVTLVNYIKNSRVMNEVKGGAKATELTEDRERRYGDLDGDGDEDAVLWFCGYSPVEEWCSLVVFRNENGKLSDAAERGFDQTPLRKSALRSISKDGYIILHYQSRESEYDQFTTRQTRYWVDDTYTIRP